MPRLNKDEAEEAAAVIEKLFADLDDLREFARHRGAEHLGTRTRESVARVTLLNLMSAATDGDLYGVDEGIRALAEDAVSACLPLLPLYGSDTTGYKVSDIIQPNVSALPEEWADAAMAIGRLHLRLRGLDAPSDGVHRPGEQGTGDSGPGGSG